MATVAGSGLRTERLAGASHWREDVVLEISDRDTVDRVSIRNNDQAEIWGGTWAEFEELLALLADAAIFELAISRIREIDPELGANAILSIVEIWKQTREDS